MLKQAMVQSKDGRLFIVVEPTIGQMVPFMRAVKDDTVGAMMALMRRCVCEGGVPLGDKLDELPGSLFTALSTAMSEVAGLSEGAEGNGE